MNTLNAQTVTVSYRIITSRGFTDCLLLVKQNLGKNYNNTTIWEESGS